MPIRIQRKRTKGWRMPPNTVYVGRPAKWGNPFIGERAGAVHLYGAWMSGWYNATLLPMRPNFDELRGKDLACWCPLDQLCHADVLLELANSPCLGGGLVDPR
jgi:hypothetical protein